MKKALIDSTNSRVIQVEDQEFEVHGNLYWVDCPDDTGTAYIYDPAALTFEDPHAHSKDEFGNPVEPFNMQRMRAYPPSGDQFDLLYKELSESGTISKDGAWFKAITAVKQSIPKPVDSSVNVQHLNSDGTVVDFYENVPASRTPGAGKNGVLKFRKSNEALQVAITSLGVGYAVGDIITVPGSDVEEQTDITLNVTQVDPSGGLLAVTIA